MYEVLDGGDRSIESLKLLERRGSGYGCCIEEEEAQEEQDLLMQLPTAACAIELEDRHHMALQMKVACRLRPDGSMCWARSEALKPRAKQKGTKSDRDEACARPIGRSGDREALGTPDRR